MPTIATDVPAATNVKPTAFIGIDPGVHGGLAVIMPNVTLAVKMPDTESETLRWLWGCKTDAVACVELVTGYVGGYNRKGGEEEAQRTNPGSHMFTFGQSYGSARMALTAAGIRFETVAAASWQRELGLKRDKGTDGPAWKRHLKAHAQQFFPDVKVTLSTADALLLALYCKRRYG
jgi:hypothetical protein